MENEIVNIGPNQRETRSVLGWLLFVTGLVFGVYLIFMMSSTWLFIVVFVLIQNGMLLIFEGMEGVCPINALRGQKSMTGHFSLGQEKIEDGELADKLKKKAQAIAARSVIWGAVITLVLYVLAIKMLEVL